uniref:Uncharacterized protein n=1 Tax=Rhizophora mucronata TaxID=61149 RepID=A0A2P2IW30_RHIMU
MSTSAFPINPSARMPFLSIKAWTHFPSSSAPRFAQEFSIPTRVTSSGFKPAFCISRNTSKASTYCPC